MRLRIKQAESTKTIFTDFLPGARVIDIDQHVLFRMSREKARKDLDELFLLNGIGLQKAFTDEKSVRSFAAVESHPVAGTVGPYFIEPLTVFRDSSFDFFEVEVLR